MGTDEKMQGAEILRKTLCRVGNHAFAFTSSGPNAATIPEACRCTCGAYSFYEWKALATVEA